MVRLIVRPQVWGHSPAADRRRCLTELLGTPGDHKLPNSRAIGLLAPLLRAGVVSDSESDHIRSRFYRVPAETLAASGVTLGLLTPWILADLDSDEPSRWHAAGRLITSPAFAEHGQEMTPGLDFALGAKVAEASLNGRLQSGEGTLWRNLRAWPPGRQAGGIWAAIKRADSRSIPEPASHLLRRLLAAAAQPGGGSQEHSLDEIIAKVREKLESPRRLAPGALAGAGKVIKELAAELAGPKYPGAIEQTLSAFAVWLETG